MTPEEQFTKIENALSALAEYQVQHAEDIGTLRQMLAEHQVQHAEDIGQLRQMLAEHHVQHAEDIRELRQMHKGLVVAVGKIVEAQSTIIEAQRTTDEKLHALIDTVDRIIGGQK